MSLVIFKNASLLDCTGAEVQYPAAVTVEGNVIREVSTSSLAARAGADVIDCGGRTLLPGLIDAHMHLNLFSTDHTTQTRVNLPSTFVVKSLQIMEDTLMQGFTSALDAGGSDAGFRDCQAAGLVKGPRMQMCGRSLTQSGGHADTRLSTQVDLPEEHYFRPGVVVDGVDAVRKAAREVLRMGADYVKIMAGGGCASPADEPDTVQFSLEEMKAAVEEADDVGKYCLAHCYSVKSIMRCLEAGVKRIEHGNFMDAATARAIGEHGAIYVPTLATYDIMSRCGEEFGIPAYFLRKMKIANERALDALRHAVDAGLVIGSGSDMVGPGQPFKANEIALKSKVMGPMGAILSATKVNAEIMGVADRLGTIEPGKLADLLLVDGDPLENPAIFQNRDRINVIMQDGVFIKKKM